MKIDINLAQKVMVNIKDECVLWRKQSLNHLSNSSPFSSCNLAYVLNPALDMFHKTYLIGIHMIKIQDVLKILILENIVIYKMAIYIQLQL